MKTIIAAAIAAAIGSFGLSSTAMATEAEAAAGAAVFQQRCSACHFLAPGKAGFGPNLHGIYGRKAGTTAGFAYSKAMEGSGLVWDADNLRAWIADNEKLVPGTRMRHVAITDRAEQDYLIAFLKDLK